MVLQNLTPLLSTFLLMLYCTTAPLDRYVTLPDRTPCTQMMTSHSICSKDFFNPWYTHPKKYYPLSVHLLPSELPTTDKVCPWLSSMDLIPWPNLWHLLLWRECGRCCGRDRQ